MVRDELPNDIESLKDLVLAQSSEVEHLKLVIQKLQRLSFGRRSEKLEREIEQLEFRLEELQIAEAPAGTGSSDYGPDVAGATTGAAAVT